MLYEFSRRPTCPETEEPLDSLHLNILWAPCYLLASPALAMAPPQGLLPRLSCNIY